MAIRMQHYLSYDRQKGRWQYVRMFPPAVRPLTGRFYKHSYPKAVSYEMAKDLACDQTAEYLARVEAAHEALGTKDGIVAALQAMRAKRREGLRAIATLLNQDSGIVQRANDREELRVLAERIGIPVPDMSIVHVVVDLNQAVTDWKKWHGPWRDAAAEKKAEDAKRRAANSLFEVAGTADMAAISMDAIQSWADGLDGRPAYDYVADVKTLYKRLTKKNRLPRGMVNPAADIETPPKPPIKNPRDEFSDDRARLILQSALASDDPLIKFGHLLMAFEGVIISEMVFAPTSEIQIIDNVWCWHLGENRMLKTDRRPRVLPLHPAVLHYGFLDHVRGRNNGLLFDIDNTRASARFMAHLRDELQIKERSQDTYSWRHRFISGLVAKKVDPTLRRYLDGHAPAHIDEKHYIHHHLPEMVEAIGGLKDPTEIT